jgi:hypothetical protein
MTFTAASPKLSVRLYKTISRETIDGQSAVSARYKGKDEFIDLVPFMQPGSIVRTSKSVREPAGGFNITFADQAQRAGALGPGLALETVYGLVEPMDVVEIRMWGGTGLAPFDMPVIMRGFVSDVSRQQVMTDGGQPQRQVIVSGMDYGKIWQTFQVIYLAAYADREALLTNFHLWELFGIEAQNALSAAEFVRTMVQKVINPHIKGFMPENSTLPTEIKTGDSIAVKHGVVNNSYQQMQGSIYEILRFHGDVGVWNELYTEDRQDGVHCVYRPVPALHLSKPKDAQDRKIQDDAPDPIFVPVADELVQSMSQTRSDGQVANFYWVNNSRFDLIDDMQRKLASIPSGDSKVSLKEYPNTAVKYYGVRPMYAETQQGDDAITNLGTGQDQAKQEERSTKQEAWIDKRRRLMMEMNKDNVVLERGSARVKGGLMRPDGTEAMKAGDYARFKMGRVEFDAYVVQIDHEFAPFQGYTQTLHFERGEGFARRTAMETGIESPWLAEQASRSWSM